METKDRRSANGSSTFKAGRSPIVIATDDAARGLDVSDIAVVVNYDYPGHSEDYVHRIGRTARGDKSGKAYTFMTEKNAHKAQDLINVLKESNQLVNPELHKLVEKAGSGGGGFRGHGGGRRSEGGSLSSHRFTGSENSAGGPARPQYGSPQFPGR
ncbi:hypothetical protein RvY_04391 [Ramazzottius varieornatus]|uniref:Helicase C-terminal domain-containing protein n=1 Tax=Ramazzottius varieornatus TaxID=947166 RepID=A0A1D1US74_RAMVA|nr:hypothetical protein RvY_04391 [Ramazzottius varieornatus]